MRNLIRDNSLIEFPADYTIIDLETTGFSNFDKITELSAVRVRNNEITDSYQQLVNPEKAIPPKVTELTGITDKMVKNMPVIDQVIEKFMEFLGDDILVGHNITFDIRFINNSLPGDLEFDNDFIDTLPFSRKVCNCHKFGLSDLLDYYNIKVNNLHRAENDCKATFYVYNAIKSDFLNNSSGHNFY